MTKAYNPKVYYSDVEKGKFCNNCNDRHTSEHIEQVVIGSERGTTFPTKSSQREISSKGYAANMSYLLHVNATNISTN